MSSCDQAPSASSRIIGEDETFVLIQKFMVVINQKDYKCSCTIALRSILASSRLQNFLASIHRTDFFDNLNSYLSLADRPMSCVIPASGYLTRAALDPDEFVRRVINDFLMEVGREMNNGHECAGRILVLGVEEAEEQEYVMVPVMGSMPSGMPVFPMSGVPGQTIGQSIVEDLFRRP